MFSKLRNWVLTTKCWTVLFANVICALFTSFLKFLMPSPGSGTQRVHIKCLKNEWMSESSWFCVFLFFFPQVWQKVNTCREDLVYEKKIPHMTLILFKCVPEVRQDFINISFTSCLLNIIARFSWQVPFTSHIPGPKRVSCQVGLPFLRLNTNKTANVRCSPPYPATGRQTDVPLQGQDKLPVILHSCETMLATGDLQREVVTVGKSQG